MYDAFRAGGNAVLVVLLGAPVLGALVRLRRRHSVVIDQELPVVAARKPNSTVATAP
jgi:hypothetical protein